MQEPKITAEIEANGSSTSSSADGQDIKEINNNALNVLNSAPPSGQGAAPEAKNGEDSLQAKSHIYARVDDIESGLQRPSFNVNNGVAPQHDSNNRSNSLNEQGRDSSDVRERYRDFKGLD